MRANEHEFAAADRVASRYLTTSIHDNPCSFVAKILFLEFYILQMIAIFPQLNGGQRIAEMWAQVQCKRRRDIYVEI